MFLFLFAGIGTHLQAQTEITNAFDDLKRSGIFTPQQSEMRQAASGKGLETLLAEKPLAGYFCFTESREHDIQLPNALPVRWIKRPVEERTQMRGNCRPGEFYTWQIGLFSPYKTLENVSISFSDLKNERGEKIKASASRCFNAGGIGSDGKSFKKNITVSQGDVQALWIGTDISSSAKGTYHGTARIKAADQTHPVVISIELSISGEPIENQGDNEGWRKTRLRWLDSNIGNSNEPTAPYKSLQLEKRTISWLGGSFELTPDGLPGSISTCYDGSNQLDPQAKNPILAENMRFVIETEQGLVTLKPGNFKILSKDNGSIRWLATRSNSIIEIRCEGTFGFDGLVNYRITVNPLKSLKIKDIRLEIPFTVYAARYMMGLGHKGGFRADSLIRWQWDVKKHQDKVWMGNINAGLNFCFHDENYIRPLVNIYYDLGKLNVPKSWGNDNKGGIYILPEQNGQVLLQAYSGARELEKNHPLRFDFNMLITPVKPLDLKGQATARFYHSNSDISADYIPEAKKAGANLINVHHKKDIYPFINYPYYDEAVPDLKRFISDAHSQDIGVRLYYTTRELTVKIPELWALRSLGNEVIHDGPGKDTRTLIHPNGPNEWLNNNLGTHFIPAWYNAFSQGKYAGDMDISVITTPDSRWNNYFLKGLDWMVKGLGIDGIYIDDSALDHQTLQRARRILDADGKRRLIDIHSWNHMNEWAGYANSLHLYLELLPYVDRTWIGEGFEANNPADFWLVEMSGIPFGLMSETLDARNIFRGMTFGMLPRLPWSGNPVPLWNLWDKFGMDKATFYGYWDERNPILTGNPNLTASTFKYGNKALVVISNWTDLPQTLSFSIQKNSLGFIPSSYTFPEIKNLQWGEQLKALKNREIMGREGLILLLE